MSITLIAAIAGIDKLNSGAGYLQTALKVWQSFETRRLQSLAQGIADSGCDIKDELALQKMMEDDRNRLTVALLMEKVRRAESIWTTYCLGILLGRHLNRGVLDIEETLFAEILSRLSDIDLEFMLRLKPFVDSKNKETHEQARDNEENDENHSIRIEKTDLPMIEYAERNGLELTRMQVDRLTLSHVFSSDIGGYGNSGFAHGTFVWGNFTERFYNFVTKHRPDVA